MSEENSPETPETPKAPTPLSPPRSQLQRESDMAARPGFRNPSNVRSKAQKRKK